MKSYIFGLHYDGARMGVILPDLGQSPVVSNNNSISISISIITITINTIIITVVHTHSWLMIHRFVRKKQNSLF
jgi:hypothetical protein